MSEISGNLDINETRIPDAEHYKEIKPESKITAEEARNYWDNLFIDEIQDEKVSETENPHQEVIDGKTYYYDDTGKLYRVENELVPNTEYEINGYKYTTDEKG